MHPLLAGMHWIVIGGGPAMNVAYFENGLNYMFAGELPEGNDMFMYEQYDSIPSKSLPVELSTQSPLEVQAALVQDLHLFIARVTNGQPFGIIAHSFGAFYALKYAELFKGHCLKKLILIAPTPFCRRDWDAAMLKTWELYPSDLQQKLKVLSECDFEGTETLKLIEPYYVQMPLPEFLRPVHYNDQAANKLMSMLGDFDVSGVLRHISDGKTHAKAIIVHGDGDPFLNVDDCNAVAGSITHIIPNCGHYPFAEQPDACRAAVLKFIRESH